MPQALKGNPEAPASLRYALRVDSGAHVLGVLNGRDPLLEKFWGSRRGEFYAALRNAGVTAVTGPTFSVYDETRPSSHNVCMMLRHHQVVQELFEAGLTPLPNLYWRDERDRTQWIDWLRENPDVRVISREFTISIKEKRFERDFAGLLEIIQEAGRSFHVVLVGVGHRTAPKALHGLYRAGCTGTVVTGSPIRKGYFRDTCKMST